MTIDGVHWLSRNDRILKFQSQFRLRDLEPDLAERVFAETLLPYNYWRRLSLDLRFDEVNTPLMERQKVMRLYSRNVPSCMHERG